MTVYVVQEPMRFVNGRPQSNMDLSPAMEFGRLEFLLDSFVSPLNSSLIIDQLHDKLQDFKDEDFLLAVGNPTFIGWATAVAAFYNSGVVPMLQWDRKLRRYMVTNGDLY